MTPRESIEAPEYGTDPGGPAPRHATGHLSHATDDLSRPPDQPAEPPSQSAGLTARLAGRPAHPAEPPSQLSRRPGRSEGSPSELDGRPTGPDGPGAAPRSPAVARRGGMDGPRRPGAGVRGRGFCALGRGAFTRDGGLFVPEGRRGVATGGALGRRPERNPWTGRDNGFSAPAGRRGSRIITGASSYTRFLRPCRGGVDSRIAFHGLRSLEDSLTPPVATALDPSGVVRREGPRVDVAHALAAGVHAFSGEVPEGRHAPLASADQHAASGEGVRHGE